MPLHINTFQEIVTNFKTNWLYNQTNAIEIAYTAIIDNDEFTNFKLDYPIIQFSFTNNELNQINASQILNDCIENPNRNTILDNGLFATPIEKFLFAIIWKNGMFSRFSSLRQGMNDNLNENIHDENAIVFKQYGRFLINRLQPIADQHTFRFYYFFTQLNENFNWEAPISINTPNRHGNMNTILVQNLKGNKVNSIVLSDYLNWINQNNFDLAAKEKLDFVFFTFGKILKNYHKQRDGIIPVK
jgi:hypothetical protein